MLLQKPEPVPPAKKTSSITNSTDLFSNNILRGWQRFRHDYLAVGGLVIAGIVALFALLAPWLPLPNPNETNLAQRLLPPGSPLHPFGTDQLGRDLLARLVWGAQISLLISFSAALLAAIGGGFFGLVSGYFGGLVDIIIGRFIDILLAFPYILLAIALVASLGPGPGSVIAGAIVINLPFYGRSLRAAVLPLRRAEFIVAAQAAGVPEWRILIKDILPNVLPFWLVGFVTNLGLVIVETAGLSFLGLGVQPPSADWGTLLADGREVLSIAPHVSIIPGLSISVLVLALNFIGDGLRDAIDPYL